MPRFLALDADTTRFQVMSASVKGSAVRLEKTAAWDEDHPLSATTPAESGARFRDALKSAGIGMAPLLICLGRDRVIFKEIKIPDVPAHDEPNVVRFQAQKEFTESGDVVLDYTALGAASGGGKRVLVAAAKKDLVAACKTLAITTGVKLIAITPRPFATLGGLNSAWSSGLAPKPGTPDDAIGLLVRGDKWGEFTISRGAAILQARSLAGPTIANDTALLGEIRRTLAVHANQNPSQPVTDIYVAEPDSPGCLRDRLHAALNMPVHAYEPVMGVSLPDGPLGTYAGLAGMFAMRAAAPEFPINFASPRQPRAPSDPGKRLLAIVSLACAACLALGIVFCWMQLSAKYRKVANIQKQKIDLENQLHTFDTDFKRIKALTEWQDTNVNWLDELYDMTARVPDNSKIHITSLTTTEDPTGKKKQVATINLKGVTTEDPIPLDKLMTALYQEQTYKVPGKTISENTGRTGGFDRQLFKTAFTTKIDLEKRLPNQFSRTLPASLAPKAPGGAAFPDFNDIGVFGP